MLIIFEYLKQLFFAYLTEASGPFLSFPQLFRACAHAIRLFRANKSKSSTSPAENLIFFPEYRPCFQNMPLDLFSKAVLARFISLVYLSLLFLPLMHSFPALRISYVPITTVVIKSIFEIRIVNLHYRF